MAAPSTPPKTRARAAVHNRPDRRAAILLAAEKLFAEHGYHAVSIRQIALEAQVPLALVAYYYGQKHELFHAIFAHWRSTIDGAKVCAQTSPGHGWERDSAAYEGPGCQPRRKVLIVPIR